MKISVDLDGCMWEYPEFFKTLYKYCRELKYEFGILTGQRCIRKDASMVLVTLLGIEPDFFYSRDVLDPRNSEKFKFDTIIEKEIDYNFDDCEYNNYSLPKTIIIPSRGEEYEEPADFFYSFSIQPSRVFKTMSSFFKASNLSRLGSYRS